MAGGGTQRWVEKYILNPVPRLLLRLGLGPRHFALLETRGHKTGRRRQTPIGGARFGREFWLVSEHGAGCAYVRNLSADPAVRVKIRRTWHAGRATVVPDDDAMARHRQIVNANGWIGRADGVFFRRSASSPVSVRVDLD